MNKCCEEACDELRSEVKKMSMEIARKNVIEAYENEMTNVFERGKKEGIEIGRGKG